MSQNIFDQSLIEVLAGGGVAVIPTDTIYGIVGSALNSQIVERIYRLRKRASEKPCIILMGSIEDLKIFDIEISEEEKNILDQIWPGKTSVILSCNSEKFQYLHRGTNALAFRLPDNQLLIELIKKTGPLIAPSANWEGESPATTINEAKQYFGETVDAYIDQGSVSSIASTLVKLEAGRIKVLRSGAGVIPAELL